MTLPPRPQGLCKIATDAGAGLYTVTQVFWDGSAFAEADGTNGFSGYDARDIQNRPGIAVGTIVHFWFELCIGSPGLELVIDAQRMVFIARISAAGPSAEADFTDERYWIKELNPLAGTQNPADPDYGKVLYNYQGGYWGPAINLAEYGYTPKTHNLAGAASEVDVLVFVRTDLFGILCYQFRKDNGTNALLDAAIHTDTAAHAPAKGDLIYGTGDSPPVWNALAAGASYSILSMSTAGLPAWFAKGADGKVLRMTGGALVWGDPPAVALLNAGQHNDTVAHAPAQGEVIVGSAANLWSALAAGASQSLLYNSAAATPAWLAPGTDKQLLTTSVAGGVTSVGWQDPPAPTGWSGSLYPMISWVVDGTDIKVQYVEVTVVNGLITAVGSPVETTVHTGTDCSGA
jgi:hypothetical protein